MQIGKIHKVVLDGTTRLKATIKTRTLSLICFLDENQLKASEQAPDYIITETNPQGEVVEIGAAWLRTPQSGKDDYISMSIDDMSFDKPLYAYAFKKGGGHWDVTWSRPKARETFVITPQIKQSVNQENSIS